MITGDARGRCGGRGAAAGFEEQWGRDIEMYWVMDQHANWSDDAAAYALGALDPEEARRFEDHVQSCPECRTALAEMRAAVIALPLGAPQVEVPRQLRRQLLAEVKEDARMRRGQRGAPRRFPARRRGSCRPCRVGRRCWRRR